MESVPLVSASAEAYRGGRIDELAKDFNKRKQKLLMAQARRPNKESKAYAFLQGKLSE